MKTQTKPFFLAVKSPLLALGAAAVVVWPQNVASDTIEFQKATMLFMPNTNAAAAPSLSSDGLTLYFQSDRSGGLGGFDLWSATRSTRFGVFGAPVNLGPAVNSSSHDLGPSISMDGLSLFFNSRRPGAMGIGDIYVATRATTHDSFGMAVNLGAGVNSSSNDAQPHISADGLTLFFQSDRPGGLSDYLYMATRLNTSLPFGEVENLGPTITSFGGQGSPSISADGLSLFFTGGPSADNDLVVSTRASLNDSWCDPVNLGPNVNGSSNDDFGDISWDGLSIVFASDRTGSYQIYEALTKGYATWIEAFGLTGGNATADDDPDSDGLKNGVEFVLGGNPAIPSTAGQPMVTLVGGNLVFTFHRADASETADVTLAVQAGFDLKTWPTTFPIGRDTASSAGGVTVAENGTAADTVTVTVPRGSDAIKFARLIVTVTQ